MLWHPWLLLATYLTWMGLLGPATAVQIADSLKHKTGNFPKKPPPDGRVPVNRWWRRGSRLSTARA